MGGKHITHNQELKNHLTFCLNGSTVNRDKGTSCCLPQLEGVSADLAGQFRPARCVEKESLAHFLR